MDLDTADANWPRTLRLPGLRGRRRSRARRAAAARAIASIRRRRHPRCTRSLPPCCDAFPVDGASSRRSSGCGRRSRWLRRCVLALSGVTLHRRRRPVRDGARGAARRRPREVLSPLRHESNRDARAPAGGQIRLTIRYGFHADVPPGTADGRLRLVGRAAVHHGRWHHRPPAVPYDGQPISLYLLPKEARPEASVQVFGDRAVVWSRHNGTYVLVADARVAGLPEVLTYMQQATH